MQLELEFNEYDDVDDEAYWRTQPQVIMQNFSNYVIFPKQGLIWSLKSQKWVGAKNKKRGYWQCTLTSDEGEIWNTMLHRAIWIAVNGDIPQGYEVNHISEEKDNNCISNLNLLTRKENCNFGTRNERMAKALSKIKKGKKQPNISKALKGNTNGRANLNGKCSKQVAAYKDGVLIMTFPSTAEANRNGYHSGNVSQCCRGCFHRQGNNTYKGYQWQYLN